MGIILKYFFFRNESQISLTLSEIMVCREVHKTIKTDQKFATSFSTQIHKHPNLYKPSISILSEPIQPNKSQARHVQK